MENAIEIPTNREGSISAFYKAADKIKAKEDALIFATSHFSNRPELIDCNLSLELTFDTGAKTFLNGNLKHLVDGEWVIDQHAGQNGKYDIDFVISAIERTWPHNTKVIGVTQSWKRS